MLRKFFKMYSNPQLYTEDEIIDLGDALKAMNRMTLMDDNLDFFKLIDYDIKSTEVKRFKLFGKNITETLFYINKIIIGNGEKSYKYDYTHPMCSEHGVKSLLKYRERYLTLKKNYLKFKSFYGEHFYVND